MLRDGRYAWYAFCNAVGNCTAVTIHDLNIARQFCEAAHIRAGKILEQYEYGSICGWWPVAVVLRAAGAKYNVNRIKLIADFSFANKRAAILSQILEEQAVLGQSVLCALGHDSLNNPNHVVAVRNCLVFDSALSEPVHYSQYSLLTHVKRMYVITPKTLV